MKLFFGAVFAAALAMLPAAAQEDAGAQAVDAARDLFARDRYATTPIVCPFKGAIDYKPGEISCALLAVPENREKPSGREIQLHFIKIHAREPKDWDAEEKGAWTKREDPIIYLTGGPGAQAAGYVKRFKDHGVRDHRDLYVLEQRGIGVSEDFCPLYARRDPSLTNVADFAAYQRGQLARMEGCFAEAQARGVDLSGYNTIENARDVKALRRALGFESWNVWGISYGSILGQAYLREDADAVRAAVIDAIVPIDPSFRFQKIGGSYQRDLDLLKKACDAQPSCARAFPDFVERYKAAIQSVMEGGPLEVAAIDAELFPSGTAWFFHDLVAGGAFAQLYEQDNYATLPAFIAALTAIVEKRDAAAMRILTAGGAGGPAGFSISEGMYNAIACNDGWYRNLREVLEEDRAEHPILAAMQGDPALADEMGAMCARYGMIPRPVEQYAPLVTDIRTLIVEGEMDPITPPPFAKEILPGFANGTYVEFAYAGHGPTRSVKCAGDFLTKFYDAPEGALDLSCPESMEAPKFVGPLYPTRALTRLAVAAAEDPKNVALPALWIGKCALALLIAFVVLTLSPVARLINGAAAPQTGGARPLAWVASLLGTASAAGLAYSAYATYEASEFALIGGLLPMARWFVYAGLAAGAFGAVVLVLTVRARAREWLPVGTLLGLVVAGAAAIGLAAFYIVQGVAAL